MNTNETNETNETNTYAGEALGMIFAALVRGASVTVTARNPVRVVLKDSRDFAEIHAAIMETTRPYILVREAA